MKCRSNLHSSTAILDIMNNNVIVSEDQTSLKNQQRGPSDMSMNKVITTFQLTVTTLSGMIGVGWLFGSYIGATSAGPASIFSWGLAGLVALLIALVFAEITIAIPVTGSYMQYPYITHGNLASFIMNWMPWLSCVMAAPTEVNATLMYSQHFFPFLMKNNALTPTGLLIAIGLLLLFTYLNMLSIHALLRYCKYLTFWKVAIPLLTLTAFSMQGINFHIPQGQAWLPSGWHGVLEFSSGMCIFSFLGFLEPTTLAGELRRPERSIPVALLGSIMFCTLLYILMQWVFLCSIPDLWITHGWQQLNFEGDTGPFAAIATYMGLTYLAGLIYLDAIITPTGTAMVYTASTARMVMAMSENEYLPKTLLQLNSAKMPVKALIFNAAVGVFLLVSLNSFDEIIKLQSSAMILAYSMGPCSFIAMRARLPKLHRPFTVPFGMIIAWAVFVICNTMIYCTGWTVNLNLFIVLAIGLIAYLYLNPNLFRNQDWKNNTWLICHWLFLASLSYVGAFGDGLNLISTGFDYALIILESTFILWWATQASYDSNTMQERLYRAMPQTT